MAVPDQQGSRVAQPARPATELLQNWIECQGCLAVPAGRLLLRVFLPYILKGTWRIRAA